MKGAGGKPWFLGRGMMLACCIVDLKAPGTTKKCLKDVIWSTSIIIQDRRKCWGNFFIF